MASLAWAEDRRVLGGSPRTWRVDPTGTGDAPTIQAGIDSAQAGDEVVLAAGTYTWTSQGANGTSMIRMKGDIVLRSEAGATTTTLDAESNGRVIECVDVRAARIEGLTITGGRRGYYGAGGGISSSGNSQITIADCDIQGNVVFQDPSYGGGVYCEGGTLIDCEIADNEASGPTSGFGGGIYCRNTTIVRCTIQDNRVSGADGYAGGAGVLAYNSSLTDCWIEGNVNSGSLWGAEGGGVALVGGEMLRCTFVGNFVQGSYYAAKGGGAHCRGSCSITDCVFIRNRVTGQGPVHFWGGAGIAAEGTSLEITGCTLVANSTLDANPGSFPAVGGIAAAGPTLVTRCIIAANVGAGCNGPITFSCTNLYGNSLGDELCGIDGGGNFSADPEFCAADPAATLSVFLQSDSPCAPGNHPGGTSCGLVGAGPVGCNTVGVETRTWTAVKFLYR
jgi:hypothetical protein